MKAIYCLSILLFCFSLARAQEFTKEPVKGSRVVYVKNTLSEVENYKLAGKALLSLEYGIEKSEKDFGILESNALNVYDPIGTPQVQKYYIAVQDSLVKITSKILVNTAQGAGGPLSYKDLIFRKKIFGGYGLFQGLINVGNEFAGTIIFSK